MNTQPITSYVEMCGLRIATENLGTDVENPMGRYYNFDDAQTACPDGWRLMTFEEHTALCEQTWKRIETRGGIKGMALRDDNGVELFLPLTGWKDIDGDLQDVGEEGNYWSSSPCTIAYCAYYLGFDSNGNVCPSNSDSRRSGLSLRCVQENSKNISMECCDTL